MMIHKGHIRQLNVELLAEDRHHERHSVCHLGRAVRLLGHISLEVKRAVGEQARRRVRWGADPTAAVWWGEPPLLAACAG